MIDTRRLLGVVLIGVALSACSDNPPPGPRFTTTALFASREADETRPAAPAQQEALRAADQIVRSRIAAMGLLGARTAVDDAGIRVTLPGKHEQLLAALAQRGRLAFREVLAGPFEATGSGGVDAEEARELRQSEDLAAGDRKATKRALAALSCDGGDDPLEAEEDPALPLVACEQKPAAGASRMAYVLAPQTLDNSAIRSAKAEPVPDGVGLQIQVQFTSQGREQWSELTAELAQKAQARGVAVQVAFVLDTAVVSAPQVTDRIEGDTRITGDFTRDEVDAIAGVLTTQPLPLSFDVTDVQVRRS